MSYNANPRCALVSIGRTERVTHQYTGGRSPDEHGASVRPREALAELGVAARVIRRLGGNANMHWLLDEGAVLRRYGPWRTLDEVAYELRVIEHVAAGGFSVPVALCAPRWIGRHVWCVFCRVPGTSRRAGGEEARERGRLLAELHQHLASLGMGQRPRWMQRAEVLGPQLEELIRNRAQSDEAKVLLEYVERARAAFVEAGPLPTIVVHGDFTRGNVRYVQGRVSAIIDFDFTHLDLRVADFTWPWGWQMCDDFLVGYEEVSPLDPAERAVMRPAFWVGMLEGARDWLRATDKPVSFVNTIATLRRRG